MNYFKAADFDSTTIAMRARGCCARDEGGCDEVCRIRQDIVLTAIRNSESHYIVSAAMDPMKKAGVSEAVINAMPARQNASTHSAIQPKTVASITPSVQPTEVTGDTVRSLGFYAEVRNLLAQKGARVDRSSSVLTISGPAISTYRCRNIQPALRAGVEVSIRGRSTISMAFTVHELHTP